MKAAPMTRGEQARTLENLAPFPGIGSGTLRLFGAYSGKKPMEAVNLSTVGRLCYLAEAVYQLALHGGEEGIKAAKAASDSFPLWLSSGAVRQSALTGWEAWEKSARALTTKNAGKLATLRAEATKAANAALAVLSPAEDALSGVGSVVVQRARVLLDAVRKGKLWRKVKTGAKKVGTGRVAAGAAGAGAAAAGAGAVAAGARGGETLAHALDPAGWSTPVKVFAGLLVSAVTGAIVYRIARPRAARKVAA